MSIDNCKFQFIEQLRILATALFSWLLVCYYDTKREGEPMPRNQSAYSQGERWFLLYQYFIKNSNKDTPVTFEDIRKHLLRYDIVVHPNTLRADIATLQSDIFGLTIEYDRRYNKGAGAHVLKNPPFEPYELRYITDSIQASKFLTQTVDHILLNQVLKISVKHKQ